MVVPTAATSKYPARTQAIRTGSAVLVDDAGGLALGAAGAVRGYAQPTTPALGEQALISRWDAATGTGWWVGLTDGRLTQRLGDGTSVHDTVTDRPLHAWTWYAITASWRDGVASVCAEPALTSTNSRWSPAVGLAVATAGTAQGAPTPAATPAPTVLAASPTSTMPRRARLRGGRTCVVGEVIAVSVLEETFFVRPSTETQIMLGTSPTRTPCEGRRSVRSRKAAAKEGAGRGE